MPKMSLIQTEKSFLVQKNNTYLVSFDDKQFTPNAIELTKILKANNLTPLKITTVNLPGKTKRKGRRGNHTIRTKRAKKYYVKLKEGEKIAEDTVFEVTK
jgi:ribosomal protein L23